MAPELMHMREDRVAHPWALDVYRCQALSAPSWFFGRDDLCSLSGLFIERSMADILLDGDRASVPGSFGVLLHELRPHPRHTMEPLRCASWHWHLARLGLFKKLCCNGWQRGSWRA